MDTKHYLDNLLEIFKDVLHENASGSSVDVVSVAVLPEVLQVLAVLQDLDLVIVQNLANGAASGRPPSLTEDARDKDGLDFGQGQVSLEAESLAHPVHQPRVEELGRLEGPLLSQRLGRLLDFSEPLRAGLVEADERVVGVDRVLESNLGLRHCTKEKIIDISTWLNIMKDLPQS